MSVTFSLQKRHGGREQLAIRLSAEKLGATCIYEEEASLGTIPIGTVEYCEPLFGKHRIDFFPEFLHPWLNRVTWKEDGGNARQGVFVKDATRWKSDFESRTFLAMEPLPVGDWWVSEVVRFEQEWRYYVAAGRVATTGWYAGGDEDEPAPELDVTWPEGFSGAVDFGRLDDGRISLVECHAPFACGWYGEKHEDYARWQQEAWEHSDWWR